MSMPLSQANGIGTKGGYCNVEPSCELVHVDKIGGY